MLKIIFFKVLAPLCLKKSNKRDEKYKAEKLTGVYHLLLLAALAKSEIRFHYLKRKGLERALMILLFCFIALQVQSQLLAPLKIGEKLPAAILNMSFPVVGNVYQSGDSIKLSQYKGKIILLDFWATWCTNCIYKFPVLEELQQKYRTDLVVVLVATKRNKDTAERIKGVIDGTKAPYRPSNLFTIYNDTLLYKLFPHSFLPHYAWIGIDGTLKLLSSMEMLTPATIVALLPKSSLTPQKP